MSNGLRLTLADPSLRVLALLVFFFGTTGAAVSPYSAIIGIQELHLSNSTFATLMFAGSVVNVMASMMMGIFADRIGNYRTSIIYVSLFGVVGFGMVYFTASASIFVVSKLLLLPIFGALNSLIFANVRAQTSGHSSADRTTINATIRSTISLSWVLMPGAVGLALAGASSMLPAYLIASLFASLCFVLGVFFLTPATPHVRVGADERYRFLSSLGEVFEPRVALRVVAIALICSMLNVSDVVRSLIVTGQAGGSVADLGIIVGLVAFFEIVFILLWGRADRWLPPAWALAFGAGLYALYLVLQGLSTAVWQVYAQTLLSGFAAAAIISLPITYLQDLIADRPGLGSSLIAVNMFLGAGIGAIVFAIGTRIGDYGSTSILGAAVGCAGVVLLIILDGTKGKKT